MLNTEFAEWMHGFCCLSKEAHLTSSQLWVIKNHLNLVVAVEGFLDKRNQWLDEVILSLVLDNVIKSPPDSITQEIFSRYAAANRA